MLLLDLILDTFSITRWTGLQIFFIPLAGGLITFLFVVAIDHYLLRPRIHNIPRAPSVSSEDSSIWGEQQPLLYH